MHSGESKSEAMCFLTSDPFNLAKHNDCMFVKLHSAVTENLTARFLFLSIDMIVVAELKVRLTSWEESVTSRRML